MSTVQDPKVMLYGQGTLAQLDTRNPVLYMDFPEGRLKFFGTIVFPHNKYMVLKVGTKDILCEDVLESMVRPPTKPCLPLQQSVMLCLSSEPYDRCL